VGRYARIPFRSHVRKRRLAAVVGCGRGRHQSSVRPLQSRASEPGAESHIRSLSPSFPFSEFSVVSEAGFGPPHLGKVVCRPHRKDDQSQRWSECLPLQPRSKWHRLDHNDVSDRENDVGPCGLGVQPLPKRLRPVEQFDLSFSPMSLIHRPKATEYPNRHWSAISVVEPACK
jgi:hypothetical protein